MRIGVDARELTGRPTGVGRYLAELLAAWARPGSGARERHQFVLYSPAPPPEALAARVRTLEPTIRVLPGGGGTWWEQGVLAASAARDGLNVFFAPAYTAPLGISCPIVLTIHDVSYFAHPEWFARKEGMRRRLITRLAARRADKVLTVSEFSRSEIMSHLGVQPERVQAILHGAGAPAFLDRPEPPADTIATPPAADPLVLYVGSILNRRRVPDVISAFRLALAEVPEARLEIIGENRSYPHQDIEGLCRVSGAGDRIRVRSYVPDGELAAAYRRARAFAFLSEYEGFGLPPLEALACGIPPVLLDTAVAREVCGPAARYVAPGDVKAAAAALVELLRNPASRAAVLDHAAGVLSRYSWAEAARRTLSAIEAAGG